MAVSGDGVYTVTRTESGGANTGQWNTILLVEGVSGKKVHILRILVSCISSGYGHPGFVLSSQNDFSQADCTYFCPQQAGAYTVSVGPFTGLGPGFSLFDTLVSDGLNISLFNGGTYGISVTYVQS